MIKAKAGGSHMRTHFTYRYTQTQSLLLHTNAHRDRHTHADTETDKRTHRHTHMNVFTNKKFNNPLYTYTYSQLATQSFFLKIFAVYRMTIASQLLLLGQLQLIASVCYIASYQLDQLSVQLITHVPFGIVRTMIRGNCLEGKYLRQT